MKPSSIKQSKASVGKPIVSFVIAVGILVLGTLLYWNELNSASKSLENETIKQTTLRAQQVNSSISVAVTLLFKNIDKFTKELAQPIFPSNEAQLLAKIDDIKDDMPPNSVLQVAYIDAEGYLSYSNLGTKNKMYLGDRKHFKVHLTNAKDQLYISEPVLGRVSKEWSVQCSRPIRENGVFKGVLVFSLSVKYLEHVLQEIALANTDSLSIFKKSGEYLARNLENEKAMGKSILKKRPFLDDNSPLIGVFRDKAAFDNVERIYVWQHIQEYPIVVLLGLGESDALGPIREKIKEDRTTALWGIALFWLFVLSLLFFSIRLMQMREVKQSKEKLEKENNELDRRVKEEVAIQNQYKNAIDNILIVSITDVKGYITYVNDNFVRISGYSKEELIGQNHNIIRHPSNPPELFKELWQTIQAKKLWRGTFPNRKKDGTAYYVQASIFPLLDSYGNVKEYIAVREDITEQVLAKRRVTTIFDNQESIVVLIHKEQGVIEANHKFYEIFDFDNIDAFHQQHQCVQELFIERQGYVSPYLAHGTKEIWTDILLATPKQTHLALMHDRARNERIFSVKISQAEVENTNLFLATFMDITELELARIAAKEAAHAKSLFLANMSHEIRTPLNGIIGFANIMMQTAVLEQNKEYSRIIYENSHALLDIINDILDLSKIEQGNLTLINEPFEVLELFEKIVELFAIKAKEKSIHFYYYAAEQIPNILIADSVRLRQVLTNLLSNAIKFTPNGGKVRFEVHQQALTQEESHLVLSIKDTGIGISKEQQTKIFEPFVQAESGVTRQFGGTGLGLSISSDIVRKMGSTINVNSALGEGSRFFFELKLPRGQTINTEEKSVHVHKSFAIMGEPIAFKELTGTLIRHLSQWGSVEVYDEAKAYDGLFCFIKTPHIQPLLEAYKAHHPSSLIVGIIDDTTEALPLAFEPLIDHLLECPLYGSKIFNAIVSLYQEESYQPSCGATNIAPLAMRVLVAEDNPTNRQLIGLYLEKCGVTCVMVENGQEALNMLQKEPFDMVFMDIYMPVMDGIEATKSILEDESLRGTAHTPIIALTANTLKGDKERYLKLGMDGYLSKPIDFEELHALLQTFHAPSQTPKNTSEPTVLSTECIPYDKERIAQLMSLDTLTLEMILDNFFLTLEDDIQALSNAIEVAESEAITQKAHYLKGACANLFFEDGARVLEFMEKHPKECQDEHIVWLRNYFQTCKSQMN